MKWNDAERMGVTDVGVVGERILELVEVAVREHLEGVGRSQAERLMALMMEAGEEAGE